MKQIMPFIVQFLFLVGCAQQADVTKQENGNVDKSEPTAASEEATALTASGKSDFALAAKMIDSRHPKWVAFWKSKAPGFSWSGFSVASERRIVVDHVYDYTRPVTSVMKRGYPFSPDGKRFIEPYSGCVQFSEENGELVATVTGGDPDSEVLLVEMETKKSKRILSCGTPCSYEYAGWLGNTKFFVFGSSENPDQKKIPVVYLFDIEEQTEVTYAGDFPVAYEDYWKGFSLLDVIGIRSRDSQ